jgi:hypothetical protein
MLRRFGLITFLVVLGLMFSVSAAFATRGGEGGRGDGPVIYVTSQGLYYDSIVTADPVPWEGPFQELEVIDLSGGMILLQTEFGPGDPGHRGGRWWVDVNGDGEQDAGDHYFLCPLLGPGRETP